MSDATDVLHAIDQLRRDLSGYHGQLKAHDDLQRHCDNQRKRIGELEMLYAGAKAERDEAMTAHAREYDRANFLEAKNAELKEELAKWERLADGIDLPEHPAAQFAPKDLERENAKLRELVRDALHAMWACDNDACVHGCECDQGIEYPKQLDCLIERRARAFGIEVGS